MNTTPNTTDDVKQETPTSAETQTNQQNNTPADDVKQETPKTPDGLPTDPEQLQNMVRALRKENAKDRTAAKQKAADDAQASLVQQIGKALGLINDDADTPTPDDLTRQLTAEQEAKRTAQTALAVYRAAQGIADPDMLTDSARFHKALAHVDITDQKAVTDAVKAFIKDHPQYAGTRAPQAGGANTLDHPAGSGETTPQSTSLNQAVARALAGK
nr:MAG TPA: hypothetical protein [Caudoviricetes sp.]